MEKACRGVEVRHFGVQAPNLAPTFMAIMATEGFSISTSSEDRYQEKQSISRIELSITTLSEEQAG